MTKKEAVIARDKVPKQSHWDCLAPLAMTARLCFAGIGADKKSSFGNKKMQYAVPQFVEVEDKIVGPLTLKQFLILLVGGFFGFMFWSIFKAGAGFFVLMLPTAVIFGGLAFGKFNGRPVISSFPLVVKFFMEPRRRIFKRPPVSRLISKRNDSGGGPASPEGTDGVSRVSRLHKLAYALDQKSEEQERLIHESGDSPLRSTK